MKEVTIREAVPDDDNFITHSWVLSNEESNYSKEMPRSIYYEFHRLAIRALLKRDTVKKLVAVSTDDPSLIYGYAIYEILPKHKIFHYIYVKRPFSGFGIANDLIKLAPFPMQTKHVYTTHVTYKGRKLVDRYDLIYCPYLLFGGDL